MIPLSHMTMGTKIEVLQANLKKWLATYEAERGSRKKKGVKERVKEKGSGTFLFVIMESF